MTTNKAVNAANKHNTNAPTKKKNLTKSIKVEVPSNPPYYLSVPVIKRNDRRYAARKTIEGKPYTAYSKVDHQDAAKKLVQLYLEDRNKEKKEPKKDIDISITFEKWLDKWLDTYQDTEIKDATRSNYKTIIDNHVKPYLGKVRLIDLTEELFRDMKAEMHRDKSLSSSVKYLAIYLCKGAITKACDKGYFPKEANPMIHITNFTRDLKKDPRSLTIEETRKFCQEAKKHRLFCAFLIAILLGLRRSEILGLRWSDIDWDQKCIHVKQGLFKTQKNNRVDEDGTYHRDSIEFDDPKARSKRRLPLTPRLMNELLLHKQRQELEKTLPATKHGKPSKIKFYCDSGLVFARRDGIEIYPDTLTSRFKKIATKLNFPDAKLHDLRRTATTTAIVAEKDPELRHALQKMLGHSSEEMTLDYMALQLDHIRRVTTLIELSLFGADDNR